MAFERSLEMSSPNLSWNQCCICGYYPKSEITQNFGPMRFWDPDDGWRIGTLCGSCRTEYQDTKPQPEDYAYRDCRDDCCTNEPETDEDPILAL